MKCVNSTVSQSQARLKAKLKSSRKLNKQFKQIKEQEIILNKNQNLIFFLVALILLINGVFIKGLADDDDHEEKNWYKKNFDKDDGRGHR